MAVRGVFMLQGLLINPVNQGVVMKFKLFSMLVILGMLSVIPMIYMGKIDPLAMLGGDFAGMPASGNTIEALKAKAPKNLTSVSTDEKVQVYRWRDENGVMQYSSTPPESANAEQIELNPNSNVIEASKVPAVQINSAATVTAPAPAPYSVKGMKQVMEDAQAIEGLLQQRDEGQRKMLGNI
jgi:hypothetical protein